MLPGNHLDEPTRRLAVDEYLAPVNVRVLEGRVIWRPVEGWRKIKPTVEMFTQFVNLSHSTNPDKDVQRYVRKWGPLLESGELVSDYVERASAADAILRLSENLEAGDVGEPKYWDVLTGQEWLNAYLPSNLKAGRRATVQTHSHRTKQSIGSFRPWPLKFRLQQQRVLVAGYINAWLIDGEVRPALSWNAPQPIVNLAIAGPFGALGLQLLETAAGYIITVCSGCRKFFDVSTRERKPKIGQGRYCADCIAADIPIKLAKRRKALGISKPQKKKTRERKKKRANKAR